MSSDGILVAIFQSAKSGYLEDLEAIFGGASPETALELANVRDISDFTPLHYAAGANHHQVVRLLALNKADINAVDRLAGDTPLHKVRASSLALVCALLSHAHAHAQAASRSAQQAAEALIEAGADLLAKNHQGLRPLDLARSDDLKGLLVPPSGASRLLPLRAIVPYHPSHQTRARALEHTHTDDYDSDNDPDAPPNQDSDDGGDDDDDNDDDD